MRTAGLARRLLGLRGMFGSPENLARTRSSSHSYESAKTKVSRAQCLTSPDCIRVSAARWGALRLAPTNPAEVSVAAVCVASQRRPRFHATHTCVSRHGIVVGGPFYFVNSVLDSGDRPSERRRSVRRRRREFRRADHGRRKGSGDLGDVAAQGRRQSGHGDLPSQRR
jgi:hypothetical protein